MYNEITIIRYHCWWPSDQDPYYIYNIVENTARVNYYNSNYAPRLYIDGFIDGGYLSSNWETLFNSRLNQTSPLNITLSGSYDATVRSGNVTVDIYVEESVNLQNLRLRVALTESFIQWSSPNGSQVHNQTFRDMITTTNGIYLNLQPGHTISHNFSFTTPEPLATRNCEIVAFVQSDQNKEIVQSAKSDVNLLSQTSIDNPVSIPQSFKLSQNYPNPFNGETVIGFETAGSKISLEVFDVTGALVKTLASNYFDSGNYSIVWDGTDNSGNDVSSGIYFYKIDNGTYQDVKRMAFLK